FSTSTCRSTASPFGSGPSPPRLPKEEQEIFERLQRQSTGAFSTPRDDVNEITSSSSSSSSSSDIRSRINQSPDNSSSTQAQAATQTTVENGSGAAAEDDQLHPNMRRGAPPEFEGDINPKTGEVGGPKNEPLRWGSQGDYSYNGRVTDF
ncbi:DUF1674-domain-containing protein, partial [Periconia macrospinosa]